MQQATIFNIAPRSCGLGARRAPGALAVGGYRHGRSFRRRPISYAAWPLTFPRKENAHAKLPLGCDTNTRSSLVAPSARMACPVRAVFAFPDDPTFSDDGITDTVLHGKFDGFMFLSQPECMFAEQPSKEFFPKLYTSSQTNASTTIPIMKKIDVRRGCSRN